MADDDRERRLLKYARAVATRAEQLDARLEQLGPLPGGGARMARKDVMDAIETFEKPLTRKIDAAS